MACRHERLHSWLARHLDLLTVAGSGALIALGWGVRLLGAPAFFHTTLLTAAAVLAGTPIAKEAWGRLRARQFSIALLVTIATLGALWIGEPWEAAAVTFLYISGGWLENLTLAKTRAALRSLVDLAPRTARVKRAGELVTVAADDVQAGETVVVLPGDRVPVDGRVTSGRAALDTAALTGEPLPVEAGPGDDVLGGSVSKGGYLEVEAVRVGADTTFSRLIYLVAEAQEQKPKVQRILDRFARWYTPAVIAAAGVLFLFTRDIRLALTFLVIGCPGALVVAAPVATVAGLGHAARQGILIKGGERLERIVKVDVVAFDKTGTLTLGQPRVETVIPFTGEPDRVIALAAAAEQRSEHHLATAILAYAREKGVSPEPASEWSLEPGLGAVAQLDGQTEVLVGNRRLLTVHEVARRPEQELAIAEREAQGETVALVATAGEAVGLIGITDPLRPEAAQLVGGLKRAGIRRTVMLTGDNPRAAARVAERLGIDEVRAGLLPAEKVAALRELQGQGHVVAMVGDGVNDAPALAAADVSVAMGASGTQAAIEAADIALMTDRLGRVPYAIGLSRRILRIVRQNVAFAVAVVLLLLAGVVGKMVHLGSGMLIHEASVLLVIANGMRLLGNGGNRLSEKEESEMSSEAMGKTRRLATLVLIIGLVVGVGILGAATPALAHCDNVNGPVVGAARQAVEQENVKLILPYVKADSESELTAVFTHVMEVRKLGGEAKALAERFFFETAVRLHRQGEGAGFTGLKYDTDFGPALEAAEESLREGSPQAVLAVLTDAVEEQVTHRYEAVLTARREAAERGTVEADRERAEAELAFELYVNALYEAATKPNLHGEGAAAAPAGGHTH